MPANRPASDQVAECAECGRTSPLALTGDGTPKGWDYIADEQIILCPAHRNRLPEGWQDIIRIYKWGELGEQGSGINRHHGQEHPTTRSSR
ncbi:hypothetical protein MN0502_34740 (plasmid) [Arthrobacter sp. MN05-02]|nr:hypothetical protein MN0502_34740 [Arthrobacter sp. MN05-02]